MKHEMAMVISAGPALETIQSADKEDGDVDHTNPITRLTMPAYEADE